MGKRFIIVFFAYTGVRARQKLHVTFINHIETNLHQVELNHFEPDVKKNKNQF